MLSAVEVRSSGGIGRHAGLKILCPLGRAGSSPALSTKAEVFIDFGFFSLILTVNQKVLIEYIPGNISGLWYILQRYVL